MQPYTNVYNDNKLRSMANGKFYETPREVFLDSWDRLGNKIVMDEGSFLEIAQVEAQTI